MFRHVSFSLVEIVALLQENDSNLSFMTFTCCLLFFLRSQLSFQLKSRFEYIGNDR